MTMGQLDEELENKLDAIFEENNDLNEEDNSSEDALINDDNKDNFFSDDDSTKEVITELLETKGIKDGKITIMNENNEEEQVDFFELDKEEQLEILNTQEETITAEEPDLGLTDEEINFLNSVRQSGKSVQEFLVEAIGQPSQEESYDIDAYSDEELFLLDLKSKYELTDEELTKELEKELLDENLFKKKVSKTREEYKQLEDNYKLEQQQKFEQQQQEQYNDFAQTMVGVATKTPEFYGIELEDNEKNEVLSYILDLDESGASTFYKELNNPDKLYEAAWFLKYGKDAFEAVQNAYEDEIKKLKKDTPKRVVKKGARKQSPKSIYDLN